MSTLADDILPARFSPPRAAVVDVKLNIRSEPSRGAARVSRAEPGQTLLVEAVVRGEAFLEQNLWFQIAGRRLFVWSGGVTLGEAPVPGAPPAGGDTAPDVTRREDGTIKPLGSQELEKVFGKFEFRETQKRGFIQIVPAWINDNIVSVQTDVLADLGFKTIRVHRLAEKHFVNVFTEIEKNGLAEKLLSCGGTFVPRHIGRDPSKALSSHSWGIAIDLNVDWNGYGNRPALPGQIGSLRELVPIFAKHGFAWGGHFRSGVDGMHFELARRDP
jgi:hypothetical protein